jgi:hypothetical protein
MLWTSTGYATTTEKIMSKSSSEPATEAERRQKREKIFRALTLRRKERPALSEEQIRAARNIGRP